MVSVIRQSLSRRRRLVWLCALFGVIAIVADSFIDSRFFDRTTFLDSLVTPTPMEIYIRSVAVALIVLFGIAAARMFGERDRALAASEAMAESLRKSEEHLREELARRSEAEQEARRIGSYLDLQVRRMPIGLVTWDAAFKVQMWNEAAERIFGFTKQEAIGRHPLDFLVPQDESEDVSRIWTRLNHGDSAAHSVNSNLTRDGKTILCRWTNTPLHDDRGEVVGVMSMVEDITDSRRREIELEQYRNHLEQLVAERSAELETANEQLRRTALLYRTIFDAAGDEVFTIDFDGRFLQVNEATCRRLGYSRAELLEMRAQDVVSPEQRHQVKARIEHTWKNGSGIFESVHMTKQGQAFPIEINTCKIDFNGRPAGLAICRDISKRKAALEAVQKSERRLQKALHLGKIADWELDLPTGHYSWSDELYAMLERDRALGPLAAGEVEWYLSPPDLARAREYFGQAVRDKTMVSFEAKLMLPSGRNMTVLVWVSPLVSADDRITTVVGVLQDVTERRQEMLEKEVLQAYVVEITKAQESERKRISQDLHDGVLQSLCLLSLEVGAMVEKPSLRRRHRLERLKASLDETTEGLRHYCHDLRPEMLDMIGLVPTLRWMCTHVEERTGIALIFELAGEERRLPVEMETALFRIAQESTNNIIKHSEARSARIAMRFSDDVVGLAVEDDGKGFDSSSCTPGLPGSLGLRGMAERARLIGGSLSIDSSPGNGTRVAVFVHDPIDARQLALPA